MGDASLRVAIVDLLRELGLAGTPVIQPVFGGGNNRTYLVDTGDERYLAKVYYSHPSDMRDRLGNEYALLSYAQGVGISSVPVPIACDRQRNIGIYEFIEGIKVSAKDVDLQHVLAAGRFAAQLNENRAAATGLAVASEACFSVDEHIAMVDRRLGRLQEVDALGQAGARVKLLVREICTAWEVRRARLGTLDVPRLRQDDHCISPSDFGFHNALLVSDGDLRFIDFEYAGWDDPAKMIGDFFCQPEVPVSLEYFDEFAAEALLHFETAPVLVERARLLLPALQIKWCCIMCNEFLPEGAMRRNFADSSQALERRQRVQLDKVEQFFNSKLQ